MPRYSYHFINPALATGLLPESVIWHSFQGWSIVNIYLFKLCFPLMILVFSVEGLSIMSFHVQCCIHRIYCSFYSFSLCVFQTPSFLQTDKSPTSLIILSPVSDVQLNCCNNLLDYLLRLMWQGKYKVNVGNYFSFIGCLMLPQQL